MKALRRELDRVTQKTVGEALEAYEAFMRFDKQNRPGSVAQTCLKLRRFFARDLGRLLPSVDRPRAEGYYDAFRHAKKKNGQPVSVDYHRNTLSEARTFFNWCVKKKWIPENPLDGVEGVGRRRHGKKQLRIDEARRWLTRAVAFADQGEAGAVAAMMTLLMGVRASEVVGRVARDLDDEGRLVWIPEAKTEAGKRTQQVPPLLQPYLRALARGKPPEAPLFGDHWRDWPRRWVARICRAAKVPVVSAHGMRGLHSTLAVESGATAHVVAAALGHESFATTAQSYAKPEAVDRARQNRVLAVLTGGVR